MSKQIIFCADGTWNGPGEATANDIDGANQQDPTAESDATNVVKLFVNLRGQVTAETQALHNETETICRDSNGSVLQVAKYLHGVGDSKNPVMKVLGGVFGIGVIARIVRGYTFISRQYEPGDSIHITGFSRGAYTARALAGMIAKVGLLNNKTYDPNDKDGAYLRGYEAWIKAKGITFQGKNSLCSLLTTITSLAEGVITRVALKPGDFVEGVRIRSVGVWDTVGAMGVPGYIKGQRHDLFSFVDTKLSPLVDQAFHAMALDEERRDFPVTRWDKDPRIDEVWFVGAHSDVGGGYPAKECGLSEISLDWMMKKFESAGVLFAEPLVHKPVLTPCSEAFHRPWDKPPFDIEPCQRVPILPGDNFDATVKERWTSDADYQKRWPKLFQE
jgi:uncharacterized protein (DUF2235 family)